MKKESFYYDHNLLKDYERKIKIVIGASGTGKSYSTKK